MFNFVDKSRVVNIINVLINTFYLDDIWHDQESGQTAVYLEPTKQPFDIKWKQGPIEVLGTDFSHNKVKNAKANFGEKINGKTKIKAQYTVYAQHDHFRPCVYYIYYKITTVFLFSLFNRISRRKK